MWIRGRVWSPLQQWQQLLLWKTTGIASAPLLFRCSVSISFPVMYPSHCVRLSSHCLLLHSVQFLCLTAAFGHQTKTDAWCLIEITNSCQQAQYISFSTWGWLECTYHPQSDRKENRQISHTPMAQITALEFNLKQTHNLVICYFVVLGSRMSTTSGFICLCTGIRCGAGVHKDRLWMFKDSWCACTTHSTIYNV